MKRKIRPSTERRQEPRVDSALAIVYRRISSKEADIDPYHFCFDLPKHFMLSATLAQIDALHSDALQTLESRDPSLASLIHAMHLKINTVAQAVEESLGRVLSPTPQRVNLSPGGLSFHAEKPLLPGSYLHLAISHKDSQYHIAVIGRVSYCEEEDLEGFRAGVAFTKIRDEDQVTLSRDVLRKVHENAQVAAFERAAEN